MLSRSSAWALVALGTITLLLPACGSDDQPDGAAGTGTHDAAVDGADDSSLTDAANEAMADVSSPDAQADGSNVDSDVEPDAGADAEPDVVAEAGVDRPCTLGGNECEPGEKCAPDGVDETLVCRPDGDKAAGELCGVSGVDDCVSGTACVPYDTTSSHCETLCGATVPCSDEDAICFDWFGPNGDVAGICLGDGCTPPSTGCSGGERCTVLSFEGQVVSACVPAGPVAVGGDCSAEECEPGAMCVQAGGLFVCRAFCDAGADCVDGELHCVWPWPSLTEVGLCRSGCDPVRQTGCEPGEGCYFEDPAEGSTMCWDAGPLAEGTDCSSFAEMCAPGLDCVLDPGSTPFTYHCRAFCDADNDCTSGTCQTTDATPALKVCMP